MPTPLPAPPVYSPCAKKWEFMHAAGLRRQHCDRCRLPVHNLSAMSRREADVFLAQAQGRRTCLTYVMRRDGTLVTRSWRDVCRWRWQRWHRSLLLALRVGILVRRLSCPPRGVRTRPS